ncbi:TadE-like protein [Caballeronia calidae]|uniref:TadE-like protein n=1 Tax=Caballeronia calidae TaxID=1777139 RepID=A0A158DRB6_9BURK|nr:TadE/TadG family type IV pilus assembly protein [Caballeronia calidae]SAK97115.1 TadE-like protein [Caballeronia calidae]
MTPANATKRFALGRAVTRLMRSERGTVTIEFVIVVPLMLLVLLGFTELYLYMRAVSLVEHTAFTLADSVGQMSNVIDDGTKPTNANSLASIWAASIQLASPNQLAAHGGVIVTSICDKTSNCDCKLVNSSTLLTQAPGTAAVLWSAKPSWQPKGMTSAITTANVVPANWPFRAGDSAVAIEVFYNYTPFSMTAPFWNAAPLATRIYERVYVRPRSGQVLPLTNPSGSPCETTPAV